MTRAGKPGDRWRDSSVRVALGKKGRGRKRTKEGDTEKDSQTDRTAPYDVIEVNSTY